jgi:hypothetical protein
MTIEMQPTTLDGAADWEEWGLQAAERIGGGGAT